MPSKRSHGEGTLRHRSDGRWELRMMDGYQKDGSPRFKTFYGKTQKEVKLKLKEYQDALISGVQLDTILYFEDWADTWFEGHRDNIAPTTQESYKYCLKMLKEGFYHRPLTVIRPIDIENFLKGMRRDGRSDSYISKARGMLYQIFQKAEANDLVRRNPVRLAEKMRASGTAKRKEAFTTAEVAHLMKVLPDDRMGLSIRLLLGTGMRMQELLALEPQFIEEDGSVIHIRQAVKVVKGTVSIGSPKSKDSIRDIPVPLNVRPCAIKLRDTTDQFIWESPKTGLPCNPTHFRDVFRKSLEEAGDVRLLTPHSCRHTYVSQMQALGVDIQTIQSIVMTASLQTKNNKFYVVLNLTQNGKRKQKWVSTGLNVKGNKKKAEQFMRELLAKETALTEKPKSALLFSDAVRRWLQEVRLRVDEVTMQGYESHANGHILPYFDDLGIKLVDVDRAVLQAYIGAKSTCGRKDGCGGLGPHQPAPAQERTVPDAENGGEGWLDSLKPLRTSCPAAGDTSPKQLLFRSAVKQPAGSYQGRTLAPTYLHYFHLRSAPQ